jgi:hypothetical protein
MYLRFQLFQSCTTKVHCCKNRCNTRPVLEFEDMLVVASFRLYHRRCSHTPNTHERVGNIRYNPERGRKQGVEEVEAGPSFSPAIALR